MTLSVFDLFSVGIGPSSSHTVGPMRAARLFGVSLCDQNKLGDIDRVQVELFGSLGATGRGHGTDKAVLLGLSGAQPETVDPAEVDILLQHIRGRGRLRILGRHQIDFVEERDVCLYPREVLPFHPNGMRFRAVDIEGSLVHEWICYSVGGGFVVDEQGRPTETGGSPRPAVPYPYRTAGELLAHCHTAGLPISGVMLANERSWRPEADIRAGLLKIWEVMQDCVHSGSRREGTLPGGLNVRRRAPALARQLAAEGPSEDPLRGLDWVTLYALAVNEENAAGGRVVTAPTNGAAGIIPAVLHYFTTFVPGADDEGVIRFLLTAGAIGAIYKETASISGAEVGCQGEVGSACSMAAGAFAEVLGGTPNQVENAAEIAMEHHLGMTCDPVAGLVQIPCIERNAIAAVKAITAARAALRGDGTHVVSLDQVVKTMRETGADMSDKYKETAGGGLAVNVIEC